MTNLATKSNAQFDAVAGAVPGPFGPLARSSGVSLESTPRITPNSHIPIQVDGQGGVSFMISFDQMSDVAVRDRIIAEAYPVGSLTQNLQEFVELLALATARLSPLTATPQQYHDVFQLFKYFPPIIGITPVHNYREIKNSNKVKASFTSSGGAAVRTVVNTTTGYDLNDATWDWDWGDGTAHATVEDPTPHTYLLDGTYTITLRVGSRGGFDKFTESVTMNVP